jgi:L-ribulokinase
VPYTLGLDFGTESVRAVLVDASSGETVATSVDRYGDGVIDAALPASHVALGAEWALQNPADWLAGLERTIGGVLTQSGVAGSDIVGLGIDFTSCTILPTDVEGTPLCQIAGFDREPHAWPKLWKHHAAQVQADRINAVAAERAESWLPRYGGRISSEWMLPKALQILEEAPHVYHRAAQIVEGADWVVWQLTGRLTRNACGAGYKGLWHRRNGYPSRAFLAAVDTGLEHYYEEKAAGPIVAPGALAGRLTADWSARLGLPSEVAVAVPIIDAHAAVLGGGVGDAGSLFLIMGTSTCHLLMARHESLVPGIAGVVEDGIVPGLHGYEAGQASVGDMLAWYVQHASPAEHHAEARASGRSVHEVLSERAARLAPGETGLVALDWWNGNRSTLMRSDLSGLLAGVTLGTRPEHIYRALIEATAFGTRVIAEAFESHGLATTRLVAGGGLTTNPLVMQIYADICGRQLEVAGAPQASALGAAMLGAVAAGRPRGGYDSLGEAVAKMAPPPAHVYRPDPASRATYDEIYRCYQELYDTFGRRSEVMRRLKGIRDQCLSSTLDGARGSGLGARSR